MTILETIKGIIEGEEAEQQMRAGSLKSKDKEIKKFEEFIKGINKRKIEIGNEIIESDIQLQALIKVKEQLEEALCVGEQESQK